MKYRPQWLSNGGELLIEEIAHDPQGVVDAVVVGSGYGGAVAASRLARTRKPDGSGLSVYVLERGREYIPGSFPDNASDLPGYVRINRADDPVLKGAPDGLFDVRLNADVGVLVASGLGGGSLINASVAERAAWDVFEDGAWPKRLRERALEPWYERAACMLGAKCGKGDFRKQDRFEEAMREIGLAARSARIAVRFEAAGANGQGVMQKPCNGCGDCVTGCNFWAKNTLAMNYLPDAFRNGARLYTNVMVSHLVRVKVPRSNLPEGAESEDDELFDVHFRLTDGGRPLHPQSPDELPRLRARTVVLAAGSLGSTEILFRSRDRGLAVSTRLGERFSTNGDNIAALFEQPVPVHERKKSRDRHVNAVAREYEDFCARTVGPTITSLAQIGATAAERITFEELAIPGALRRLFGEIVTTSAVAARLGRMDKTRHSAAGLDPLAVRDGAVDNTQIFAAMGNDGAGGRLQPVNGWNDPGRAGRIMDGVLEVVWPEAAKGSLYTWQQNLLAATGRLGGTFLASPLMQPLPSSLSGALSGSTPDGKAFTVHPLGGCPMADRASNGVVNDIGQVFCSSEADDVHPNLLVLDGSIVPTALGINPLLTIAALAERGIECYIRSRGWTLDLQRDGPLGLPVPDAIDPVPITRAVTHLRLAERLEGELALGADRKPAKLRLHLEYRPPEGGVEAFLEQADRRLRLADGARLELLEDGQVVDSAPVEGSVSILARASTGPLGRTLNAFSTYAVTRGGADLLDSLRAGNTASLLSGLPALLAVASNAGERRELDYDLELTGSLHKTGNEVLLEAGTQLRATKRLAYVDDGNPWIQLTRLPVRFHPPGRQGYFAGVLQVDMQYFVQRFATQLQITAQRDLPSGLIDVLAVLLFAARVLFKIHFWSFRLPQYQRHDPQRAARRLPGPLPGLVMERHRVTTFDPVLELPLTRYSIGCVGRPVLLIHGLGSGGIQFATPRLQVNLVQHLASEGFDVWVAELRNSIGVPSTSHRQWTLDQVARNDIPAIVNHVLRETGAGKLDIVAHCIGSAMFCTAALAGLLENRVRAAALLQVGPLITLSPGTRLRGYVAAFLKRWVQVKEVDFSVDDSADWVNAMVDRLLATYPYPEEEARHHDLSAFWRSHTHIANCNRSAAIDGRMFSHANVDTAMLETLGEVLGHSNVTTWEQTVHYAFLERLTDADARNSYVTEANVLRNFAFPVCFLHGKKNEVFLPRTSERSVELIKAVHGDGHPATVEMLPKYGHLDPLIGRNAWRDVYPKITGFLGRNFPEEVCSKPRDDYFLRRPLLGPVLGWTRMRRIRTPLGDHRSWWVVRLWCRVDDTRSPASFLAVVPRWRENPERPWQLGRARIKPLREGRIDTLAWCDIALAVQADSQAGECELIVVSAHAFSTEHSRRGEASVPRLPIGVSGSLGPRRRQMREGYASAVLAEWERWRRDLKTDCARTARRACDEGYEEKVDVAGLSFARLADLTQRRERFTFALGSCRYVATMLDRERADATFGVLRDLLGGTRQEGRPGMLLLIGDQIYADATAGLADAKMRRERFYDSYQEAWSAPNARIVLSQLPVYMMLDDHEVSDDWHPEDEIDGATREMRREGLGACRQYQAALSPRNARALSGGGATHARGANFYSFTAGGFPFFVCDTRTERHRRERIFSVQQMDALKRWLTCQEDDRPKFIVSPSVMFPFVKAAHTLKPRAGAPSQTGPGKAPTAYRLRSDGWDGFAASLDELFSYICRRRIGNLVFLCGDAHVSTSGEIWIECDGERDRRIGSCVVSSPMYAPYPFANASPDEYLEAASFPLSIGGRVRYRCRRPRCGDVVAVLSVAREGQADWKLDVDMLQPGREKEPPRGFVLG